MAKLELELLIKDAQAASSVGDIRKQLKDLKSAMLTVGEDSEEFNKLAQAAASLKDRVEEANEKIDAMNPDKFKGLNQMASGAATGIQLATASMSLLGVESEDAQKAMMRIQAAMAFAQAINDIDKLKKGFQAFNAAVKANPIIAVATALVALGAAIYKVWSAQEELKLQSNQLERQLEKQKEATENLRASTDAQILVLEAQGGQEEKIYELRRQMMEQDISNLKLSIEKHKSKIQEVADNDSLYESALRVASTVAGWMGKTAEMEAAQVIIAQNKKERREEEQKLLQEDINNLTMLEGSIQALDINYENFQKNKNKQREKDAIEWKQKEEQKLIDKKDLNDQMIWENERLGEELIAQMEAENAAQDALVAEHDQHRLEMYQADRKAKEEAYKKAHDYKKKLDEIERKREEQMAKDKIDFAKNVLGTLSVLMKDNADAQKAISAATTLIDTYAAAQSAFKAATASPITTAFPAYPFIQAGLAVAAGLARVAAIMRVDTSGASASSGGGSAGMSGGGSLSVSSQPNVSSGSQPSTLLTEQGNVMNQQSQNPIYVSVQEIRETGQVVETIEERSRF